MFYYTLGIMLLVLAIPTAMVGEVFWFWYALAHSVVFIAFGAYTITRKNRTK